jgi:hypothetical protein
MENTLIKRTIILGRLVGELGVDGMGWDGNTMSKMGIGWTMWDLSGMGLVGVGI